jgi:hypothetical protein
MSFGKRAMAGAAMRATATAAPFKAASPEQDALIEELRAMARKGGSSKPTFRGTVSGKLVNDSGPDADPVLAGREGVADARDVSRADYWSSNILGNVSAVIGVAGGLALGFAPQGVIGFMFIVWGLTAVATGRMMQSGKFNSRVFMGNAARLAGLGVIATGAFLIYQSRAEPALIGQFIPDYEAPMAGLFGK